MPISRDDEGQLFSAYGADPLPPEDVSLGTSVAAAFTLENDIVGLVDFFSRQERPPEEGFDPKPATFASKYWNTPWRNNFAGVQSSAEWLDVAARIEREEKAKRELMANGTTLGVVAAIAAGLLSPTTLIPIVGTTAKGVKAFGQGVSLGALGVAGQEAVLWSTQETRTPAEVGINVATGAVIGGILGGAVGYLRHGALRNFEADMDAAHGSVYGSELGAVGGADEIGRRLRTSYDSARFRVLADSVETLPSTAVRGIDEAVVVINRSNLPAGTGHAYEVNPDKMLVVSPESYQILAKEMKVDAPTHAEIVQYARDKGYDTVSIEGFSERPITDAAPVQKRLEEAYKELDPQNMKFKALAPEDKKALRQWRKETEGVAAQRNTNIDELTTAVMSKSPLREDQLLILKRDKVRKLPPEEAADMADTLPQYGSGVEEFVIPRSAETAAASGLPTEGSVGAAAVRSGGAGRLKKGAGGLAFFSPVTRVINQKVLPHASWLMSQLSTAGLRLEGNVKGVASSVGGTVEANVKPYLGRLAKILVRHNELYADYLFGAGAGGSLGRVTRANLLGLTSSGGKMSRKEFREAVGAVLDSEVSSGIKEVDEAASIMRKELYDYMLNESKNVGLLPEEVQVLAAKGYLNRVYRNSKIEIDKTGFIDLVASNFERKLTEQFAKRFETYTARVQQEEQLISDIKLPAEEAEQLKAELNAELERIESRGADQLAQDDRIRELREQARDLKNAPITRDNIPGKERERLLAEARDLKESGGEALLNFKAQRAAIRKRLSNLNKNQFLVDQRYRAKLAKIERSEELSLNTMHRAVRSGIRFLAKLDRYSDDALDLEVSKLKNQFAAAGERFDKSEERIVKELQAEDQEAMSRLVALDERQQLLTERMNTLAEALEHSDTMDRELIRETIQGAMDDMLMKASGINARRAARARRLEEAAQKLTPDAAEQEVKRIRAKIAERTAKIGEEARVAGADDVDLEKGVFDFSMHSRAVAEEVTDRILGTTNRLAGMDFILNKRGPELERVLDIERDYEFNGRKFSDYLESDVDRLASLYTRTMAADIEITRKFGSPDMGLELGQGGRLERQVLDADRKLDEQKAAGKLTQKEYAKKKAELRDTAAGVRRDLEAVLGRLRHMWGIPTNPQGAATRLARVAMNLNTLRFMGSVFIASIPDMGRPIMKYGLMRTMKDGFIPFVTQMKEMKMLVREAKQAGVAVDSVLHIRSRELFDLLDETREGSLAEKGLEWASSRIGLVAVFDKWTDVMKQISAGVVNGKIGDSLAIVSGAEKATAKEIREATEFLAEAGINAEGAARLWDHFTSGTGGGRVNGVWLPNTEGWVKQVGDQFVPDHEAIQLYRQALAYNVDNTIVTPGVERPLIMDSTIAGRLAFQFRSFGASSTTKTVMAGLQQRDVAVFNGTMISLALGALSYYLWAVSVGGQAYENMQSATFENWVDEAISRSGVLGVFNELQRVGETIPAISDTPLRYAIAKFGERQTTRRAGADIYEALFGPSFDLGLKLGGVLVDLDEPTQSTVHKARRVLPYQNLFYLRQLFDKVEQSFAEGLGLPEKRQ